MVSWRRVHGCAGAHQSLSCKRPVSLSTDWGIPLGAPWLQRRADQEAGATSGLALQRGRVVRTANLSPCTSFWFILFIVVWYSDILWYVMICDESTAKYMSQISHSRINGPFPTGSRRGSIFLEWLDGIILGAHFPYVVSACFYPLAIGKPSICRWHTIRM